MRNLLPSLNFRHLSPFFSPCLDPILETETRMGLDSPFSFCFRSGGNKSLDRAHCVCTWVFFLVLASTVTSDRIQMENKGLNLRSLLSNMGFSRKTTVSVSFFKVWGVILPLFVPLRDFVFVTYTHRCMMIGMLMEYCLSYLHWCYSKFSLDFREELLFFFVECEYGWVGQRESLFWIYKWPLMTCFL